MDIKAPACAQFVEKDPKLAEPVLRALLKFWPLTNSQKEVLFIGELEEVLELTQARASPRAALPGRGARIAAIQHCPPRCSRRADQSLASVSCQRV